MPETRRELREDRRRAEERLATEYGWPTRPKPSRWRDRVRFVAVVEIIGATIVATVGAGLVDPIAAVALAVSAALLLAAAEIPS